MATKYTSLYKETPNTASQTFIYEGPHAEYSGHVVVRYATFTGTIANTNTLRIAGGFRPGEKLVRFTAIRSGDSDTDNDFTFNLGWVTGTAATPGAAFAAASTGMQAAAAVVLAASDLAAAQAAADNDELVLTPTAGELEASVTHTFIIESFIP